ncbi:hypothetical protein GOP47_0024377 [Adiantum capillus-veneris]|uniref:60S acidic ribosomal protein P1 n=1 Tax=Adiantum capillus-veneris TaxID=13818 RepID=A0A9D4U267_ADICA|nr:hypothetical protein GOP47_0024377 [Adiantum capillus-veneris]
MALSELGCTYAALILHDDNIAITAEKIAANVQVEAYWPALFAKLLEKHSVEDLITNVGSGGGGAPVAAASAAVSDSAGGGGGAVASPPVEEKKEEPEEESDDDMGFKRYDDMRKLLLVRKCRRPDHQCWLCGGGAPVDVAGVAVSVGGGAVAPPPVEEKKEEPKEESDDDMGFSFFD